MTIVASNSLTLSKVNDGTITHTAWSYSADGTDRFTTVYPNLNLLDGTKYFSGNWSNSELSTDDGTYKGFTVKKRTGQWGGIFKKYTVTKNSDYTFSAFVKGGGTDTRFVRIVLINGVEKSILEKTWNFAFDWERDSITFLTKDVKVGDEIIVRYEISVLGTNQAIWNAGHKWEQGSIATPYMQSASEVTTADWPKYIGHYTDFMQADSTNPSDYTWGPMRGDDGVGVTSTVITYANSTSGTTAPNTGWTSSVPTLVKGQYLWTKTVWTYTDTSSNTGYSVSYTSKDGTNGTNGTSGIIVSSVAPASPQNGQLWQDTSTTPQLVKKWTGSEWVIWELYAQNLKADTLETVAAKIGKIYNEFDNSSGGMDNNGTITIEDSVKVVYYLGNSSTTIDLVTSSSGQGLFTQYLPDKTDASKFKQSWYMPTGLYFTDSINNFTGQITAENVSLSSWQNLILNSGYTAGDGVQPQYRRIKNLDGSYSVQFRGAVSPTSGNFPTSQVQVATLSGIYLPPTNAMRQCSDNTGKGGRVAATPSGKLYIWAPNTSSYMYIDALTYIN